MKKETQQLERRGLPGGPNEMFTYTTGVFSTEGFRMDSPDVNNYQNIIPTGSISMKEKDGSPLRKGPIHGVDNLGNAQVMYPGYNYQFPGTEVTETLMVKMGGGLLDKTIKCGSCGWEWKAADGGSDVMDCHKCGSKGLVKAQVGKEVKYGTPEYEEAYNKGEVITDEGVRSPILLDEVVVKGKKRNKGFWEQSRDAYLEEHQDDGLLGAIGSVVTYPLGVAQQAMMYGLTGKVQKPSTALGIKNKWGAAATDIVADPLVFAEGLIKGVGAVSDVAKAANEGKVLSRIGSYGNDVIQASKIAGKPKLPTYNNAYRWQADVVPESLINSGKSLTAEQQALTGSWYTHDPNQLPFYMRTRPGSGNVNVSRLSDTKIADLERNMSDAARGMSGRAESVATSNTSLPGELILPESLKGNVKQFKFDVNPSEYPLPSAQQELLKDPSFIGSPYHRSMLQENTSNIINPILEAQYQPIMGIPRKYFPYAEGGESPIAQKGTETKWLGNTLDKNGYITSTTKGGNRISFTGNQRADEWINKQIDSGKFGFDPKTMGTFPLKTSVKGLSKEDQFIGSEAYYNLQAPEGFNSESQLAQIEKLPQFQQDIINAENKKRREKVVKNNMDEVYKNPLWYAPGVIATGGLAAAGLTELGIAASPYITNALATQLPGMATVPGATVGNAITAGFAGHGLANIGPDAAEMYKNPSWSNVANLAMDVAEVAPIVGPAAKTAVEGYNSLKNINTSIAPELRQGLKTAGPSFGSSVDNTSIISNNLNDLTYAKDWAKKYGYKLPENLERIAQSDELTNRTIRGLADRHNTFVRGVSTNWDVLGQKNPEIIKYLEGQGFNLATEEGSKAAAEYMSTHIPMNTGYGRFGLKEGENALYLSNSVPAAEGYTYGNGYIVKAKRPTDFSSTNRQDWLTTNDFDPSFGFKGSPFGEGIVKNDYIKRFPTNFRETLAITGDPNKMAELQVAVNEKAALYNDLAHASWKKHNNLIDELRYKTDANFRNTTISDDPFVRDTPNFFDKMQLKYLQNKKDLTQKYYDILPLKDVVKGVYGDADVWKAFGKNLFGEVDPFSHYAIKGQEGEKILETLRSTKVNPETWENTSRAHINKYTDKLTRREEGGESIAEANITTTSVPSPLIEYVVKKGDTLGKIAAANNTSIRSIMKNNENISDPNLISINQKINIVNKNADAPKEEVYKDWNTIRDKKDKTNKLSDEQKIISFYNDKPEESYLIVDKKNAVMKLYTGGNLTKSFEVGVGQNAGDAQTVTKVKDGKTDWSGGNKSTGAGIYTISNINPASEEYYNEPAFNLKNENGIEVATTIHGTPKPRRIKFNNGTVVDNRMSNGCINGKCEDLKELYGQLDINTKVYILPEDVGNNFQIIDGKPALRVSSQNRQKYNSYVDQTGTTQKGQGANQTTNTLVYKPIKAFIKDKKFKEDVFQWNDFNDQNEYDNSTIPYIQSLTTNKKNIMKAAKISSDVYNELAKMSFGIYGTESNFGDTHSAVGNLARATNKFLDPKSSSSPDYKSKASTYGADEETRSVGLTQLRWNYLNEDEKAALKEVGITSNKDFLDPRKAAIGTTTILGVRYNQQLNDKQKQDVWKYLPSKWNNRSNYGDRVTKNSSYLSFKQLDKKQEGGESDVDMYGNPIIANLKYDQSVNRTNYNPRTNQMIFGNDMPYFLSQEERNKTLAHENRHAWQFANDRTNFNMVHNPEYAFQDRLQKKPELMSTDEVFDNYHNRKQKEIEIDVENFKQTNPQFSFMPDEMVYKKFVDFMQYDNPSSLEGEVEYYQNTGKKFNKGGESKPGPLMKAYNRLPSEKKMGGAVVNKKEFGGQLLSNKEIDKKNITMYKNYVKGIIGNEIEAVKNYDKLNRIYYNKAKELGMTAANYVMTHVVGNS